MATAFQIAKLTRRFALLDVDASGFLELSDYLRIADRLAGTFGRDRDDSTIAALRETYTEMWSALLRGDRDGDGASCGCGQRARGADSVSTSGTVPGRAERRSP